ncbi:hypothetical protein SLEP1_g50528 [Rubroshorea leprosula]|uniref:Uncharacterized protein n=1 Tax=Rubroshorea leprosula TaxID=152421 RepID=A0AAV5M2E4_9ROSI|nr:hypothetical protein SLEP1_g50528 [Rubroshorea leprosula]
MNHGTRQIFKAIIYFHFRTGKEKDFHVWVIANFYCLWRTKWETSP